MHWDGKLQRLYTGLQITTSDGHIGDGAKDIVVAQVQTNGILNLYNILNTDALVQGATNAIVAATITSTDMSIALSTFNIRTLHASTGPSYLIVNGDIEIVEIEEPAHNLIYALPLVEVCPESPLQGTLANKNASLSYKNTFTVPAANVGDLPLNTDPAAQVGAGPLPIDATTLISDIEVVGDTVYVSTATAQSATNDNGIFYSQALFDMNGKIARWTSWTKRAFPFNGFSQNEAYINNGVEFFAVDAVTGKVWAVDGATKQVVRVTAWDNGGTCQTRTPICGTSRSSCCSSGSCCSCNCFGCNGHSNNTQPCCNLPAQVRASLSCGCYSVLDLDQATRGFTGAPDSPLSRFTLFGGCGKVDIACVSTAFNSTIESPQTVTEDFCPTCSVTNFLETILSLTDRSCINVLEYSRPDSGNPDQCYFFAGTDNGLYTYALEGGGFPLASLDIDTLSDGQWIKIPEFSDPIIDIKTTGLSLYIVTRTVKKGTMTSTVYRVNFENTVDQMFTNTYVLAQSGVAPFENAPAFTGIQPVTVAASGETIYAEQLLLATNNGLFGSNALVAVGAEGIANATDQTAGPMATGTHKQ